MGHGSSKEDREESGEKGEESRQGSAEGSEHASGASSSPEIRGGSAGSDRAESPQSVEVISQAELAKQLGTDAKTLARLREERLASQDWFKRPGRGRPKVMYTREGAFKLQNYFENHNECPQLVPKFIECLVLERLPNREYVNIKVDHGEKGALKEPCLIPRRLWESMKPGISRIKVEEVRDAKGVAYRHEELATYR